MRSVTHEEGVVVDVIDEFNASGHLINQITAPRAGLRSSQRRGRDSAGHTYASDSDRLVVDEFDSGAASWAGWRAGHAGGSFAEPAGVAVNAAGDVYVADRTLSRRAGTSEWLTSSRRPRSGHPFLEAQWGRET